MVVEAAVPRIGTGASFKEMKSRRMILEILFSDKFRGPTTAALFSSCRSPNLHSVSAATATQSSPVTRTTAFPSVDTSCPKSSSQMVFKTSASLDRSQESGRRHLTAQWILFQRNPSAVETMDLIHLIGRKVCSLSEHSPCPNLAPALLKV